MQDYPKIENMIKQDGSYKRKEFEYLKDDKWIGTEWVDGITIKVIWDTINIVFEAEKGAIIPDSLAKLLHESLTYEQLSKVFGKIPVLLFLVGFGKDVNGSKYNNQSDFMLIDVFSNGLWFDRDPLENVAKALNIKTSPIIVKNLLDYIKEDIKCNPYVSSIKVPVGEEELYVDGLVCRPLVDLNDKSHRRIMCKIKTKDFK